MQVKLSNELWILAGKCSKSHTPRQALSPLNSTHFWACRPRHNKSNWKVLFSFEQLALLRSCSYLQLADTPNEVQSGTRNLS